MTASSLARAASACVPSPALAGAVTAIVALALADRALGGGLTVALVVPPLLLAFTGARQETAVVGVVAVLLAAVAPHEAGALHGALAVLLVATGAVGAVGAAHHRAAQGDRARTAAAERARLQAHQDLLAQTSELLSHSTDYARTLQDVAELAVPGLADWCGVALPSPGGRLQPVAVAHEDPCKAELARELRQRYPSPPEDDPVQQVHDTGEPLLMARIPEEAVVAAARDERHLELLHAVGLGSMLLVPLRAGRRTVGTLSLLRAPEKPPFDHDHLELASELARRAGSAVETARLYAERTEVAETLKAALQPPALPAMAGWDPAALFRPASRVSEVGGDFYDVFAVRGGWVLVVGDVTGKGAAAAALTSLARYSIRTAATLTGDPASALAHLNAHLAGQEHDAIISAVCVLLAEDDEGGAVATITSAGHPLPVLLRDGTARPVGTASLLLGVCSDAAYGTSAVALEPGDRLVLYTDGVLDVRGEEDRFGEARLLEVLAGAAPTAAGTADAVGAALTAFGDGPQPDDIALLAVRRLSRA